jgi:hypothetical protein
LFSHQKFPVIPCIAGIETCKIEACPGASKGWGIRNECVFAAMPLVKQTLKSTICSIAVIITVQVIPTHLIYYNANKLIWAGLMIEKKK